MTAPLSGLSAAAGLNQIAFVVRDFEKTVLDWALLTGAGPFYCGDFKLENFTYRGRPASCHTTVGLGYLGDMQIQIVRQNDDSPSIYKEILDLNPGRSAVHHVLSITDDIDAILERHRTAGIEVASYVEILGMRVAFLDTVDRLGVIFEYFQRTAFHDDWFRKIHAAHVAWDGKDPLRGHPLG
jgi:methylmalonyl-CoA/ethylmalonyl-CoA epimerase